MKSIITYLLLILFTINLSAQEVQDTSAKEKIQATSDRFWGDTDENTQYLIGNVQIYHDSTYMFCDSAVIKDQHLKAMGNVIILQEDSLKIFSDTVYYNADSLKAELINRVILQKGENTMYSNHIYYDTDLKVANYYDTASFFLKRTKLKSVQGVYDTKIAKATFIEKVNMIDSTFQLRTDTLDFYTEEEKMVFRAPTRIDQETRKIYCESGYYDIKNGISSFETNAQYEDINTYATGDQILYNSNSDEIQLIGNAFFQDSTQLATADKITYQQEKKVFDLVGNADYKNGDKHVTGETIHYNEITKSVKTTGRSILDEEDSHLEADEIDFDENKGEGYAIGNVIYKDKKAKINVYGEQMDIYDFKNRIKVYSKESKPLLESIIDQDTMFLTADTLYTLNQVDTLGGEYKKISAYNNVKIYKSDLQAVADSLIYNTKDEKISLFDNPIMWSDTSQFTGDTIHLKLKEKKIHKVILFPNAFICQSIDEVYFSQISGKKIIITFNDSTIQRMNVIGNAESIYYMTDDAKKYTGVSKTIATDIRFDFHNGELSKTKFSPKPNTQVLPMKSTNHETLKLKAFSWQVDRRPWSLKDILHYEPEKKDSLLEKVDSIQVDNKLTKE